MEPIAWPMRVDLCAGARFSSTHQPLEWSGQLSLAKEGMWPMVLRAFGRRTLDDTALISLSIGWQMLVEGRFDEYDWATESTVSPSR